MPKRKRSYNTRLIKATWPYSVQEIAVLLGIHKNAVLRWFKEGLQANRDKRPFLVRGEELIMFLTARQQSKKRPCSPTEFFCFKCRTPREAHNGVADIEIESQSRFRIRATCAVCGTRMSKVQAIGNLQKAQSVFRIQELDDRHLTERDVTSVNNDMEPET